MNQADGGEKEWYYSDMDAKRQGPLSFSELKELFEFGTINAKTRCWASGLDGWSPLSNIAQLKYTLLATGTALIDDTRVAEVALDILIQLVEVFPTRNKDGFIIRPMPLVKRYISEPTILPHLVQLQSA